MSVGDVNNHHVKRVKIYNVLDKGCETSSGYSHDLLLNQVKLRGERL